MTEKKFIEQNIEKWRELERLLLKSVYDPDQLHQLFVKVSSDLSYARTFYPNRSVRLYLNRLTQEVFDKLGKKKRKFDLSFINEFFSHTLPIEVYRSRKAFYLSFVVFAIAVMIGVISTKNNTDFVAVILGDDYVQMTEENINNGDPMAVYKDHEQVDMFLGITINNIRVAFAAFVLGLLGIIGTIFILFYNGIMLGAFQYYFYAKGLFMTSFLTIWIHGTIEISAIIIAGAAGIVLGNGVLFPGTYKRTTALQVSAIRALRIVLGTVPLFIMAGILESFVTRMTDMPTMLKVFIIGGSLIFILAQWVVYPWYYHRYIGYEVEEEDIIPAPDSTKSIAVMAYRNTEENFALAINFFKKSLGDIFKVVILPVMFLFSFSYWYHLVYLDPMQLDTSLNMFRLTGGSLWLFLFYFLSLSFALMYLAYRFTHLTDGNYLYYIKKNFLRFFVLGLLAMGAMFFIPMIGLVALFFFVFPPHFFVIMSVASAELKAHSFWDKLKMVYTFSWSNYIGYLAEYAISLFMFFALWLLINSSLGGIIKDLFMWHQVFEYDLTANIFLEHLALVFNFLIALSFFFFSVSCKYFSFLCRDKGYDLTARFKQFGQHSNVFESI